MDDFEGYSGPDAPADYDGYSGDADPGDADPGAPGGYDDFTGDTDPGLPGDDLIFLAMLDDEDRRRGYRQGYGSAGGCCGCALPVAGLLFAGILAALTR